MMDGDRKIEVTVFNLPGAVIRVELYDAGATKVTFLTFSHTNEPTEADISDTKLGRLLASLETEY
jgi:hypothetical protein